MANPFSERRHSNLLFASNCGSSVASFLSGRICIDQVKMRVDLQCFLQFSESFFSLPQSRGNHPGVKQQERIPRSGLHGFFTCIGGFGQFAILIESPRQRIPGIGVASDFKLLLRQIESLGELDVVIGIEEREVSIVQDLIDVPQQSYVRDQSELLLSVLADFPAVRKDPQARQ